MRIFISHSHHDAAVVELLAAELVARAEGVEVYRPDLDVRFGDDIAARVHRELLLGSDAVVVVWSVAAAASAWVRAEIIDAHLRGRPIIPLVLGRASRLPLILRGRRRIEIRGLHAVTRAANDLALAVAGWSATAQAARPKSFSTASKYGFVQDDSAFYRFAVDRLRVSRRAESVFVSGSPAVVLPREADSDLRREFLATMVGQFGSRKKPGRAEYFFNLGRTYRRVARDPGEACLLERHLRLVAPLLSSARFDSFATRGLDGIPSGLYCPDAAALVLKDPNEPDRTAGVLLVAGAQAQAMLSRLRPMLRACAVRTTDQWVADLRGRARRCLRA